MSLTACEDGRVRKSVCFAMQIFLTKYARVVDTEDKVQVHLLAVKVIVPAIHVVKQFLDLLDSRAGFASGTTPVFPVVVNQFIGRAKREKV